MKNLNKLGIIPTQPSVDSVYAEWYNEKRRYRDFEQTVASWSSVILLTFTGGILALLTSNNAPELGWLQKGFLMSAIAIFTSVSSYIIYHSGKRYRELSAQSTFIEPEWMQKLRENTITPLGKYINPRNGQIVLVATLGLIAIIVVLTL